jgi:hypothetical protein
MNTQKHSTSRRKTLFSLTLALYWGCQGHAPVALFPRKDLSTHCTGGLVDLAVGLDGYRKMSPTPELEPQNDQLPPGHYTL